MADAIEPALRARIEDFLADYAHDLDDGRTEGWPDYFTTDGYYQITTREAYEAGLPMGIITCDGRGMLRDRMRALATANIFEPHRYCHLLGRPRLTQDGDDVCGRTNFHVYRTMQDGGTAVFATGKYLDRIVLESGGPKLKERRVVLDSRRIDILLVVPL